MKTATLIIIATVISSITTGCSVIPKSGTAYGKTPPQLILVTARSTTGKKVKTLIWDHPEYFGPVPKGMKAIAQRKCQSFASMNRKITNISNVKAIGFHPLARNVNGHAINGGGYYCNISTRVTEYRQARN